MPAVSPDTSTPEDTALTLDRAKRGEILLELSGIGKSFDDKPVLSDVSLALLAGEVHALVGENGAGKSTLMNIAAGLYTADTGTLRVACDRRARHRAVASAWCTSISNWLAASRW
jgi:ABC-type sugar transport system ATPase subunit